MQMHYPSACFLSNLQQIKAISARKKIKSLSLIQVHFFQIQSSIFKNGLL